MKSHIALASGLVAVILVGTACRRPGSGVPPAAGTATSVPSVVSPVPTPEALSQLLGLPVVLAPGEVNQFLIRSPQGAADLAKVGTIHQDLGYAVGVTLINGQQIGFRYEPPPLPPLPPLPPAAGTGTAVTPAQPAP